MGAKECHNNSSWGVAQMNCEQWPSVEQCQAHTGILKNGRLSY